MEVTDCICPGCGKPAKRTAAYCPACYQKTILNDRYFLIEILGQTHVMTYVGFDIKTNNKVVIKELSLHRLSTWKEEELFRRQVDLLRQLDHPSIPAYIDYFKVRNPRQIIFYLVIEHIEGQTLKEESSQRRYTEAEVVQLLSSILDILVYLQSFNPPVIHRDIKPSNLMRTSQGKIYLIDFDVVSNLIRSAVNGDTVVGTYGYMAPEQFSGAAGKPTDIYALGMLAKTLLSREDPDMAVHDDSAESDAFVGTIGSDLQKIIQDFTQREPEQRPVDAAAALRLLKTAEKGLSDFGNSAPAVNVSVARSNLYPALPVLDKGAIRESMETWSRAVTDLEEIPSCFHYYINWDSNYSPYMLYTPSIGDEYEYVCYLIDTGFEILTNDGGGIETIRIDYDKIDSIHHCSALLSSEITICSQGRQTKICFNSVSFEYFNPFLLALRSRHLPEESVPEASAWDDNLTKQADSIKKSSFTLYSLLLDALMPGQSVQAAFFQPSFIFQGRKKTAILLLFTPEEVILLEEKIDDPDAIVKTKRIVFIHRKNLTDIINQEDAIVLRIRNQGGISLLIDPNNRGFDAVAQTFQKIALV